MISRREKEMQCIFWREIFHSIFLYLLKGDFLYWSYMPFEANENLCFHIFPSSPFPTLPAGVITQQLCAQRISSPKERDHHFVNIELKTPESMTF